MQELTNFMSEAWRTLIDSYLKPQVCSPFLTITFRGSEWIY